MEGREQERVREKEEDEEKKSEEEKERKKGLTKAHSNLLPMRGEWPLVVFYIVISDMDGESKGEVTRKLLDTDR